MYRCAPHSLVAVILACNLSFGWAASPVIGVATAQGDFRVEGSPVTGNATLFDGSTLETESASSEFRLDNGARMLLAADSRIRVYRDHALLEKGAGELVKGPNYRIQARGFQILPAGTAARVLLKGSRRVEVASLAGEVRVTTLAGRMLAVIQPGMALAFEPQEPAKQPEFTMTGCLEKRDEHYILRDLVAGVIEELRGSELERHVGNVVEINAVELPNVKPEVEGAEEVIQVNRIRQVSGGCPAPTAPVKPISPGAKPTVPAARPPRPGAPPAPSQGGGMSGTTKAIIAGVIIGGAGAGAAIALTQSNKGSISR